ncbi:MAG: CRISPR-associated endoribonuclease Cas6 [Arenicella sp.]|jgi:CRISPR-associated endoribonuclease Cas6
MRVRVVFKLKNKGAVLPFHHQELIRSLLDMMMIGNEYNLDKIPFNYSGLKGQTKVGKDGLHYFSQLVTLVFTSSNEQFIQAVIDKLFKFGYFYLGSLQLEPHLVEKEMSVVPDVYCCKYLCISPIVITKSSSQLQNKLFISPESDGFSGKLKQSTIQRMIANGYDFGDDSAKFSIRPDTGYIERLTERGKKFARIYTLNHQGNPLEIRGYTFPFELNANKEVHNFIFKNGFGEFTQYGFGMLDLTTSKNIPRKIIHQKADSASLSEF